MQDCGPKNKCETRSCMNSKLQSQCFFRPNCDGPAFRDCLCVKTGEKSPFSQIERANNYKTFRFCHSPSDFCKDVKQKLNHETMFRNKCSFTKDCLYIQCLNSFLQDTMPASVAKVRIIKCINATHRRVVRNKIVTVLRFASQTPGVHVA